MDIYALTDLAVIKQIGAKLREARIEQNIKQKELADMAGVSVYTLSVAENGSSISLITLVQILRALNRLEFLDIFFQENKVSPIAYAKLMDKNTKRRRVRESSNDKNESEW